LQEEMLKVERGEFFYSSMKNKLITNENKLELLDKVLGQDVEREKTKFKDPKKLKAFLSKEEREYRKELLNQIFKNGIKSDVDEKFLKEEVGYLTDSIKYFEENNMQGTWAKKNKTKIQNLLKEHKEKGKTIE
jgi:hypothetical protein